MENYLSLSNGNKNLRTSLIEKGQLRQEGECYLFTKDVLLAGPSQSASVILGYSVNGREIWVNAEGKSLKALEEESMKNKKISNTLSLIHNTM